MKNQVYFTEIKDESVITRLLNLCARHEINATFWLKSQSLKFDAPFSKYLQHMRKLLVAIPDGVTKEQLSNALHEQSSNLMMGSFQADALSFFFKTNFITFVDDTHFQIEIPKSVYKLQRRQSLRIPFSRHDAPKLSVFDPRKDFVSGNAIKEEDLLEFRILDVSTGGLAFASSIENNSFLKRGKRLHHLSFKVRGTEIITDADITHVGHSENDQGKPILKIGVRFFRLPMKYEKVIAQFTLHESRKLFSILD